jgi:prolyl oligopeptidase
MKRSTLLLVVILAIGAAVRSLSAAEPDPYQWLEDVDSPRAMAWVRAENANASAVLEKDPRFARFYADALAIYEAKDRIPEPRFLDGGIFNFWQDSAHVRGVWRRTSVADYVERDPSWQTVLDIDELAKLENANWFFKGAECKEPDERRCMVGLSDGGEDAVTLREFDLTSRKFVDGGFVLPRGKQDIAWADDDTLLVSREWSPGELTASGYPFVVKRLRRGQPLDAADEVFRGSRTDGGYGVNPIALYDGSGHRALLIKRPLSTFEAEYYILTPAGPLRLGLPLKATIRGLVSGKLLISVEQDWDPSSSGHIAQGTLVAIDLAEAASDPQHLRPVIVYAPGPRETFAWAVTTRDALVVATLDNVKGRASLYHLASDGLWNRHPLAIPDNATVWLFAGDVHSDSAALQVSGFLQPPRLMLLDANDGRLTTVKTLPPKFDASRDVVEQFEATSPDGTRIPYFVVHPVDMKRDGRNPTILNAYGGFQISMTPFYAADMGKLWLEKGGVYVLANIRGGGEFGPAWHEAGLKTHRQLIYDDFAAVARDLITRQITSPRRLGIEGRSNGGLLMGVEFNQHPDLWNAVDMGVPLLDMLRFEKIDAGSSWVGEYGSVSVPEERAFLASISPYANIKRGVNYPKPLIWTTTKDDRVGPQHARKFAARLEEYGIPHLFYEVTEGGHSSGANLKERAHTTAMEMTYFTQQLKDSPSQSRNIK